MAVMALLRAGIPLSLLCDLVSTTDPDSAAVSLAERPPGDLLLTEAADIRRDHDVRSAETA